MPHPRIEIALADDGLTGLASVVGGDPAGTTEWRALFEAAGLVHGLDEAVCQRLAAALEDPEFRVEHVVVARGTPPESGEDGYLALDFEAGLQAGREREDGSIDLRERGFLKTVSEGARLAVRHPPQEGSAGCSVDGKVIPAASGAADGTLVGGGAVEADGEIRATLDGVIYYEEGVLLDVVIHTAYVGDVDLRCGNLEMLGSLSIEGTVRRDMTARAEIDLEVTGSVEGGSLVAGGSMRVAGGVVGGPNSGLVAGGSVAVRHAQAASIRAEETLVVETHAVNCELTAKEIRVCGRVLGGTLRGESLVEVQDAGSPAGAGTLLAVEAKGEQLGAARIRVLGEAHSGVTVCFGAHRLSLEQRGRSLSFRFDRESDTIVVEPLNEAVG